MRTIPAIFVLSLIALLANGQDRITRATAYLSKTASLKIASAYSFGHSEQYNFNFVPLARKGPTFHDFSEAQKAAALDLLKASLGEAGFRKATGIMHLESILRVTENRGPDDNYRDPKNYHFLVFGQPGKDPWAWKFEGHHISLNFTLIGNEIVSSTPTFMGSNPGIVPAGDEKGLQVLKQETDLAFQLVQSLSEGQLAAARFSERALPEIVTGNSRRVNPLTPEGIAFSVLSAEQQKIFLELLGVFVRNYEFDFSEKFMAKIRKAGIENLHFAWAGSLQPGAGHYYRIQGPMLLIEYDNTQTNANHVHTVVRDLTNDFAEDILREHLMKDHKGR